ncbi:hypothetical protein [Mycobacteroides abscessus]|uniref:hypothetical protein n=1 Tax=Mycobacteroides abscessus TaxID=36809 RepID=UPI00092C6622|nr:hypothetical protein [Mycobacteroides abscessus]SIC59694.1 Uncharacterised protein [Mycobacteroides abscessus subsp. abscessus]
MTKNETKLITLIEAENLPLIEKMDTFNAVINQAPPAHWLVDHPTAKGVKDLPIGRVETLLTMIFQEWYVEVQRENSMFNSVTVTIRLHYKHPVTNEWKHQDGVGAVPVQTKSGAAAADMNNIVNDAVQKALPAAKSYAIKDAADHIGAIFGRDINRKHTLEFTGSYTMTEGEKIAQRIKNAKTAQEVSDILSDMPVEDQKLFAAAAKERVREINNGRN